MADNYEHIALAGFKRWVDANKPDFTDRDKELWSAYAGYVKELEAVSVPAWAKGSKEKMIALAKQGRVYG